MIVLWSLGSVLLIPLFFLLDLVDAVFHIFGIFSGYEFFPYLADWFACLSTF
ncbi:MAG: hypothetical protein LBR73_08500 [Oscillospiraceae bacterium]|jgi:hypothetical protein|nr:hypothetical protein [Oscillospiraceae bacterium]